jgi:hypothetical protein
MTKSKKICLAAMLLSVPAFWAAVASIVVVQWKL